MTLPAVAAHLWFAVVTGILTVSDVKHRRLPDGVVLPSLGGIGILLGLTRPVPVTLAAGGLFCLFLALALLPGANLGGGDVKVAPLVGAVLGFHGWEAVAVGLVSMGIFGACLGVVVTLVRRDGAQAVIPYAPAMFAAAWVGVVTGCL